MSGFGGVFFSGSPAEFQGFIAVLLHYLFEVGPALIIGFLLSGIINEFVPEKWIERHLGGSGIKPILWATLIGSVLPICCWGSLPLAVSFQKKGARLGPVLAFLVATPGTSISAVLVTWAVLGFKFAIFIFTAVIIMGLLMGMVGELLFIEQRGNPDERPCQCCAVPGKRSFIQRLRAVLKFAFVDLVKDIGLETMAGLVIAAIVASFDPVGKLVSLYLGDYRGFIFALVFGILMYVCATSSPPMVDAFIMRGLTPGAGITMLLAGPITSYGTILVIRKKFGFSVLFIFLAVVALLSLGFGVVFKFIFQ
ncbi:MAG: permease [candidate division WOR-3 bacterium]